MFDKIDFKRSLDGRRVIWQDNGFGNRYFILVYPIVLVAISIMFATTGLTPLTILGVFTTVALFISCIYYIQHSDKLTTIDIDCASADQRKQLENALKQIGWQVSKSNNQYITTYKLDKWVIGVKMAILFHKHLALINVQNRDGMRGYFPFSFGRNKKLTAQLITLINSIQLNQPDPTKSTTP